MRGVILAAGDGGRLRPLTYSTPKVLLPLWGQPLISYPMEAMLAAGVRDIAIVVGYRAPQVIEVVQRIAPAWANVHFVHNADFEGGNAISVATAEEFVGDSPFVLSMGDHVVEPAVIPRIAQAPPADALLAVDSQATLESQVNDATRVLVRDDGLLLRIGKTINDWNAVDIGIFRFSPRVFSIIRRLREQRGVDLELNTVMQTLADGEMPVATRDVEGLYWNDIDTVEDYRLAVGD